MESTLAFVVLIVVALLAHGESRSWRDHIRNHELDNEQHRYHLDKSDDRNYETQIIPPTRGQGEHTIFSHRRYSIKKDKEDILHNSNDERGDKNEMENWESSLHTSNPVEGNDENQGDNNGNTRAEGNGERRQLFDEDDNYYHGVPSDHSEVDNPPFFDNNNKRHHDNNSDVFDKNNTELTIVNNDTNRTASNEDEQDDIFKKKQAQRDRGMYRDHHSQTETDNYVNFLEMNPHVQEGKDLDDRAHGGYDQYEHEVLRASHTSHYNGDIMNGIHYKEREHSTDNDDEYINTYNNEDVTYEADRNTNISSNSNSEPSEQDDKKYNMEQQENVNSYNHNSIVDGVHYIEKEHRINNKDSNDERSSEKNNDDAEDEQRNGYNSISSGNYNDRRFNGYDIDDHRGHIVNSENDINGLADNFDNILNQTRYNEQTDTDVITDEYTTGQYLKTHGNLSEATGDYLPYSELNNLSPNTNNSNFSETVVVNIVAIAEKENLTDTDKANIEEEALSILNAIKSWFGFKMLESLENNDTYTTNKFEIQKSQNDVEETSATPWAESPIYINQRIDEDENRTDVRSHRGETVRPQLNGIPYEVDNIDQKEPEKAILTAETNSDFSDDNYHERHTDRYGEVVGLTPPSGIVEPILGIFCSIAVITLALIAVKYMRILRSNRNKEHKMALILDRSDLY